DAYGVCRGIADVSRPDSRLVLVNEGEQLGPVGANIADVQRDSAGKLSLNAQTPGGHVGSFEIRVDAVHVTGTYIGTSARAADQRSSARSQRGGRKDGGHSRAAGSA